MQARGAAMWAGGFPWGLSTSLASAGQVNITVSTEALSSKELCGNEMPAVPAQGRVDTVIKPLLVQVRRVEEEENGMDLGTGSEQPLGCRGRAGSGTAPGPQPRLQT